MKRYHLETVESEIRREKAEALGRAGERLEQAIRGLERLRQEFLHRVGGGPAPVLDGERGVPADLEQTLTAYARLYEEARQLRHVLIVQREAVGLWKHEDVDRQYPLPEPLPLPPARREGSR